MDAGAARLQVQALGEFDHEGLGGAVHDGSGARRRQAGDRGDIDDPPEAPLDHAGQQLVGELADGHQHHLEEGLLFVPSGGDEGAGRPVAGIVDQGVDDAPVRRDAAEHRVDGVGLRQIGRQDQDLDAVPQPDLVGEDGEAVGAPGGDGEVIALAA